MLEDLRALGSIREEDAVTRPGFFTALAAAAAVLLSPAPLAGASSACEPFKGAVQAQLQTAPGVLVLQGTVDGTLGGVPFSGGSLTVLMTPIEGIKGVDNVLPAEGFSESEEDGELRRRITTDDSGVLVKTSDVDVFLLVLHGHVTGDASGEIHYQGTVDLETGEAALQINGAICF